MAFIGVLGDIAFSVSNRTVKTFESMKWDSSAKYVTHDRHLKAALIEFVGTNADSITFKIVFSAYLGLNPFEEIEKFLEAERNGKAMRLVLGMKLYGRNKWVIEKTSKDLERFDNRGNLLAAQVNVTLKEYAER